MAAGSKPHEHVGRIGNQVHHAVGSVPGLEFRSDTRGAAEYDSRPANDDLVVQPARFSAEPILQPPITALVLLAAFGQHVANQRLWRGPQRRQHAPIQQPRLHQPRWRRRRPFLRRTPAITFNP